MWKPLTTGTCDAETDREACVKQISSQSRDAKYIPIMPLTVMPLGWGSQQHEEVHATVSAISCKGNNPNYKENEKELVSPQAAAWWERENGLEAG